MVTHNSKSDLPLDDYRPFSHHSKTWLGSFKLQITLVFIATLSSWKSDWAELSWMVQVPDFEIVKCLPSTHTYIHRLNNENDSFLASSSARRPCFLSTQLLGSAHCARTSHTQSVTYISHPDFKWSSRGSLKGQIGSVPSLSGAHSEPAIIPVYFLCWWLWHAVDM